MKSRVLLALALGVAAMTALPGVAHADTLEAAKHGVFPESAAINSMWVIVAACFVMFMQAGFAFLEIGFSRGKNVGTVVAKILLNFSIAAVGFYAVGFAFAFGTGDIIGSSGFLLQDFGNPLKAFPIMGLSDATIEAKWFFQFTFCAVSLAIVWGTTLERIKFGVYVIYAIIFSTLIYPIGAHWVFGGGWLQANVGMQDFAGSTAVHLIGATGGLAVLLLLGARKGKYGADGRPRPIPGHSMPLFGLGVIILWLGWFGFNPGSTLGALDGRFTEILMITMLAAASGVIAAAVMSRLLQKTLDIGMIGNGAIGGLVGITAPSGYVETWAAIPIGLVAGVIVVVGILAIDRILDDPVGALSAHGLAGIWGTLACGFFTSPRLAQYAGIGDPEGGLLYSGSLNQLGDQALGVVVAFAFVFAASFGTFWVIKKVYGLRVSDDQEEAGLDISEHGMYGYPEQFIPQEEYGFGSSAPKPAPTPAPAPSTATAMVADQPSEA
jgi:ammonium transporter, Amt family